MLPMIEDPALVKRVRAVYRTLGLPTRAGANKEKVLAYMQHDKKASGSSITVIKCPGLGCWRADKLPMTELPALLGIEYSRGKPIQRQLQLVCAAEVLRTVFWLLTRYAGMAGLAFWTNLLFVLLACARGWAALTLYKLQEEEL